MRARVALAPQFKVTAQTLLLTNLLRLSDTQLEEAIAQELDLNPALERGGVELDDSTAGEPESSVPSFFDGVIRTDPSPDEDPPNRDPAELVPASEPPLDRIIREARLIVPADQLRIVVHLIYCLDEHGYLRVPERQLATDLSVPVDRVREAIRWVHQLDPPGVGARDARECLILQCLDLESRGVDCLVPRRVLEGAWEDFVHQRWKIVAQRVGLSLPDVQEALSFIREHLYPYPLSLVPAAPEESRGLARPDLIVRRHEQKGAVSWSVEIPGTPGRDLRIGPAFTVATRAASGEPTPDPAAQRWIQQSVERARTFIDALRQRQKLLLQIGEVLIEAQSEFFARGPRFLQPLTRAQVAQRLQVHESTISRAVSDKVLQLPDGRLIELSDLFDGSAAVKEAIREIVAVSEAPLSDRAIAERLRSQSIALSRRSITSYREKLGIPTMGLRRRRKALARA